MPVSSVPLKADVFHHFTSIRQSFGELDLLGGTQRPGDLSVRLGLDVPFGVARAERAPDQRVPRLESVQQSHFRPRVVFWHLSLQIEMQIGAQMRRTVIPHLKTILITSKLKVEIKIKMK